MHILAIVAVILVWGVGMIVRPAGTVFLTVLVGGLIGFAVYTSTLPPDPPPHARFIKE
jgi:hypothetical protein